MNELVKFSDIMNTNNLTKILTTYLPEDAVKQVLATQAVVTEKIHGENFRFGVTAGIMHVGQRRNTFDELEKHPHFHKFSPIVLANIAKLSEHFNGQEFVAFGELYGKGMQSGFNWRFDDGMRIIWFDVKVNGLYMPPLDVLDLFDTLGVERVPFIGQMTIREALALNVEDMKSIASDTDYVEGVVINPVALPECWNLETRLIIKHKTQRFSENKQRKKKMQRENNAPQFISDFVDFVTVARIEHAIQALEEDGKEIVYDMKDLRFLVGAVIADIEKEENEGNQLPKDDRKFLGRHIPKFYTQFLQARKDDLLSEI